MCILFLIYLKLNLLFTYNYYPFANLIKLKQTKGNKGDLKWDGYQEFLVKPKEI